MNMLSKTRYILRGKRGYIVLDGNTYQSQTRAVQELSKYPEGNIRLYSTKDIQDLFGYVDKETARRGDAFMSEEERGSLYTALMVYAIPIFCFDVLEMGAKYKSKEEYYKKVQEKEDMMNNFIKYNIEFNKEDYNESL